MKTYFFIFWGALLMLSCASAQDGFSKEAHKNIEQLRRSLHLSPDQVQELVKVESRFLEKTKTLSNAVSDAGPKLIELKAKRKAAYKKILSRQQFLKFQAIEKGQVNKVPLYSE